MKPDEYPDEEDRGDSGFLKSFTIYLVIFAFGFLAASFGGGVKDSAKKTANLVANTAKETFLIDSGKEGEFVPLKSSESKKAAIKTSNIVVAKPKPSLPVVIPEPTSKEEVMPSSSSTISLTSTSTNENEALAVPSSTQVAVESSVVVESVSSNSNNSNDSKLYPLIYEIRITGGSGRSAEDYVKIFNPSPKTLDLSGWKLRKRTQSGSESSIRVFPDGTSLAGGKVLTWANNGYATVVSAELMSSQTLAANNSVGLLNKDGVLIDAVGWGDIGSVGFVEGSAYPANPEEGQVLLRKQAGGFLVDTQNNAVDFEIY